MTRATLTNVLIARGDMRGAGDAYIPKKGAHGGKHGFPREASPPKAVSGESR
jgi:hypothetical protein